MKSASWVKVWSAAESPQSKSAHEAPVSGTDLDRLPSFREPDLLRRRPWTVISTIRSGSAHSKIDRHPGVRVSVAGSATPWLPVPRDSSSMRSRSLQLTKPGEGGGGGRHGYASSGLTFVDIQ